MFRVLQLQYSKTKPKLNVCFAEHRQIARIEIEVNRTSVGDRETVTTHIVLISHQMVYRHCLVAFVFRAR